MRNAKEPAEPNYLKDKRAAARYLDVSVHKIHKLVQANAIRYVKIGPLVKFRPEDLAAYIEQNSHGGKT